MSTRALYGLCKWDVTLLSSLILRFRCPTGQLFTMVMHFPWISYWSLIPVPRIRNNLCCYLHCRWLRLLHVLALSLPILLLVLISQRAMSGQVKLHLPHLKFILWVILDILLNVIWWIGSRSFNRRSLHHIGDGLNPYEQAISIIGKTLAAFDEDNLIPCFGFGDGMLMLTCLDIGVQLRRNVY